MSQDKLWVISWKGNRREEASRALPIWTEYKLDTHTSCVFFTRFLALLVKYRRLEQVSNLVFYAQSTITVISGRPTIRSRENTTVSAAIFVPRQSVSVTSCTRLEYITEKVSNTSSANLRSALFISKERTNTAAPRGTQIGSMTTSASFLWSIERPNRACRVKRLYLFSFFGPLNLRLRLGFPSSNDVDGRSLYRQRSH